MPADDHTRLPEETIARLGRLADSQEGEALYAYLDMLRQRHVQVCCSRSGDELLRSQGAVKLVDEIESTLRRLDLLQQR